MQQTTDTTFYHLIQQEYETDRLTSRANPIVTIGELYMPVLQCDVCGTQRCGGQQQRHEAVTDPELARRLDGGPLAFGEWWGLAAKVREHLNLAEDVMPGDTFGLPTYQITLDTASDFLFPNLRAVISQRVLNAFQSAGLSGYHTIEPGLVPGKRVRNELPPYYELCVIGTAWRKGTIVSTACNHCGRRQRTLVSLEIDPERWDGSDIFTVDGVTSIIGASARARDLIVEAGFTNVQCRDFRIPTFVDRYLLEHSPLSA